MFRQLPNIPKIVARWKRGSRSDIPDYLIVPFAGMAVKYIPYVEQPGFHESMAMIQNMTDPQTGYQRQGPRKEDDIVPINQMVKPWLI